MSMNLKAAQKIQSTIDIEFGFDIAVFQRSELRSLAEMLEAFLATEVETDDLTPADEA